MDNGFGQTATNQSMAESAEPPIREDASNSLLDTLTSNIFNAAVSLFGSQKFLQVETFVVHLFTRTILTFL
jgi:hypothetical protein